MKRQILIAAVAIATAVTSCKKDDNNNTSPLVTISGVKTISVPFSTSASYTFFRFSDSSIIANTDSATSKWDFGLRQATFIVNSHASGVGSAGVSIQSNTFTSIATAPATGYAYDTTAANLAISNYTVWATYNKTTNAFVPNPNTTFVFKTADGGHYAKMEILAVDYAPFTGYVPVTLLYKIHYSYQANGSTTF